MATKLNKLQQVNLRLFAGDVKEAKRRAAEEGMPWQLWLRLLVKKTLAAKNGTLR